MRMPFLFIFVIKLKKKITIPIILRIFASIFTHVYGKVCHFTLFKVERLLTKHTNSKMNDNFSEAIQLMIVGMLTVFSILLIVIVFGTLLIKLVNKYAPEEVQNKKAVAAANNAVQQVDATVKAVIDATVAQITGGKGRVTKITKL